MRNCIYKIFLDLYAPVTNTHPLITENKTKTLTGSNLWPSYPPTFRAKFESYIEKMKSLGDITMEAIATGLNLNPNFFKQYLNDSFWVMRIIGYPCLQSGSDDTVGVSCGEVSIATL